MNPFGDLSLEAALAFLAAGALVVIYFGTKITKTADTT